MMIIQSRPKCSDAVVFISLIVLLNVSFLICVLGGSEIRGGGIAGENMSERKKQ